MDQKRIADDRFYATRREHNRTRRVGYVAAAAEAAAVGGSCSRDRTEPVPCMGREGGHATLQPQKRQSTPGTMFSGVRTSKRAHAVCWTGSWGVGSDARTVLFPFVRR